MLTDAASSKVTAAHLSRTALLYPLSEPRDVAAVQKAKRPLPRATTLTGMSYSAGHSGCDRSLGATESGHPVPNGSPSFSLLPLAGISHSRPAAFVKPP